MSESIFDAYIPHRPKRHAGKPLGPAFRGPTAETQEIRQPAEPQIARADDIQSFYVTDEALDAALIRYSRFQLARMRAFNHSKPVKLDQKNPSDDWRKPGTRFVPPKPRNVK